MNDTKSAPPKAVQTDLMAALAASIPRDDGGAPGQAKRSLPPVHLWNPPYCGDIGLQIRRDGSWWQDGIRFTREALVKLFATILRKDEDGNTYLVTPVEKVIIHVEDAPFIAVRVDKEGDGETQALRFLTNLGDEVLLGADNPLRVETDPETLAPAPYVLVRGRLEARINRPTFYEIVNWAEEVDTPDGPVLGLRSQGQFFPLGPVGMHLASDA